MAAPPAHPVPAQPSPMSAPAAPQAHRPVRHAVRFMPADREVHVEAGTSLLEAARGAGLPVASACRADGVCGRCGLRVLAGRTPPEATDETRRKRANRIAPELRLACRIPVGDDLVVTAPYW